MPRQVYIKCTIQSTTKRLPNKLHSNVPASTSQKNCTACQNHQHKVAAMTAPRVAVLDGRNVHSHSENRNENERNAQKRKSGKDDEVTGGTSYMITVTITETTAIAIIPATPNPLVINPAAPFFG